MLWRWIRLAVAVLAGVMHFVMTVVFLAVQDESWHMCSFPLVAISFYRPHDLIAFSVSGVLLVVSTPNIARFFIKRKNNLSQTIATLSHIVYTR